MRRTRSGECHISPKVSSMTACVVTPEQMASLDGFFALALRVFQQMGGPLAFYKRDHEAAYEQVPVFWGHISVCVIAIPVTVHARAIFPELDGKADGEWVYCVAYGQSFGTVPAGTNYEVLAALLRFLYHKALELPAQNYRDDAWAVEPVCTAESGFRAMGQLNRVLGLVLRVWGLGFASVIWS